MTSYLHLLSDPLVLGVALVIGALIAIRLLTKNRKPWLRRIQPKPLLTSNEIEFYHRLQRALPRYHVFPQVSFAALLTDDGKLPWRERWAIRARFDRKIAD